MSFGKLVDKKTITPESLTERTIMFSFGNLFLVSDSGSQLLNMYDVYDFAFSSVITLQDDAYDVLRSPTGNIVYTTGVNARRRSSVITTDKTGNAISQKPMAAPLCLSISEDNAVYCADAENGIYESKDDGLTWSHIIRLPNDDAHCWQVVKVQNNVGKFVYWTLQKNNSNEYFLRLYSVGNDFKSQDVLLPGIDLSLSKLAYNGKGTMLLAAYKNDAVLAIPVNDPQNVIQLSFEESISKLNGIYFDQTKQLLYLCCCDTPIRRLVKQQNRNKIKIFSLIGNS